MTPAEAIDNAARLLRNAESETDREMMGKLDDLARSWIAIGELLAEHEDARQ